MALLAFMLTFTFGMAAARFEERRQLVLEEANAIGTAYLRTDFLDDSPRTKMRDLLRDYVSLHVDLNKHPNRINDDIRQADQLLDSIWQVGADAAKTKQTPIMALLISAVNEVIDLKEKRTIAGLHAHVPGTVWLTLILVSAAAMYGMGYYCGRNGTSAKIEAATLIMSYSLVLVLAFDLDRSLEGTLKTDQQPILDVSRAIGLTDTR
jgi:hypothetical protein